MANRRRGTFSLPEELKTNERLSTKKELAQRKSLPPCPYVPVKPRKVSFNPNEKPKPLFFTKCVELSPLYDVDMKQSSYIEQCFYGLAPIGEGSFGKVYRTRSREDDELYAIKRQKPTISLKDIYAEVRNNEKIEIHPNCAQFYMAWEEAGEVFLVLEYCDISLADYANVNSDIPESLLWDVLFDICQGLNYLHQKRLIHLDVKPGNIMMRRGTYKLCDFGTLVDLNMPPIVRKSTLSDGDAKYLALEVLDGVYQTSCDIFGLGISLLELAADLELPSHGPLWQQLRRDVLPLRFYDKVSLGLKIVIERMLDSKYANRPSAAKILKFATLKIIAKRDKTQPRIDYANPYRDPVTGIVEIPLQLAANTINNNNNFENIIDTPRCANNIRCLSANTNCTSVCGVRDREQGPSRTLGRKSLFKLLVDDPEATENHRLENSDSTLAYDLDCTMDVDTPEKEMNRTAELDRENIMITSTPNFKLGRKMPKSKLIFE
ncbi:membrane-associated tyrosine- and threonine-specific cdc2-inhibitory kinase isoform X2 [Anoplophora glabripennis]|uniref:membrane-associated tyrosine- and threonine-specific cdc2-inhibitory kinase isoform X2 n=1 Tax=Anoplophora glabripennis TaxID=217634 RepID=UPI0008745FA7|nr:membrane-associated tyrosine- and threonine-specific cdc2-inhibitory kinase isoform X2 [Anoplophora glabripennis]